MSAIIIDFAYARVAMPLLKAIRTHIKRDSIAVPIDQFSTAARCEKGKMDGAIADTLISLLLMRLPIEMNEDQYLTAIRNGEAMCAAVLVFAHLRPDLLQSKHMLAMIDSVACYEPSYLFPELKVMALIKNIAEIPDVVFSTQVSERLEGLMESQPTLKDKIEDVFANLERRSLDAHLRSVPSMRLMRTPPRQQLA